MLLSVIALVLDSISQNPIVKHAFSGIGIAVCAILIQAVIKMGKAGLVDKFTWIIGILAFAAALFFDVPTIPIIVVAGVFGILYKRIIRKKEKGQGEKQI